MLVLGWDSSTKGATWALLEMIGDGRRIPVAKFLSMGECKDRESIKYQLRVMDVGRMADEAGFPPPYVIGVEMPEGGLGTKRGDDAGSRKRGENLMETKGTATFIATWCEARDYPVETMPSWAARKQIGLGRGAKDADVERMVRLLVPSWPKRSNDHDRDAAAIAIAAGMRAMMRNRASKPVVGGVRT